MRLSLLPKLFLLAAVGFGLTACPPKPEPTPPPGPVECSCSIPDSGDSGWHSTTLTDAVPYNALFIKAAREVVGDRCGQPEADSLRLLATALQSRGICAAGPWADAILVARPDGRAFEEWHSVSYDDGCWTSMERSFKGYWTNASARGCL